MRKFLILIMFLLTAVLINAQETDTIVDPRDGQVYNIVRIGKQWWMAENLNATKYSNGTPLVDGTGAGDITGDYTTKYFFWDNDDSATYAPTYGALYTWVAAMNGAASSDDNPSGVQGVCPCGWHLPSDSELKELEMFLGMSQADADGSLWRGTDEGGKLKEKGILHWADPNTGATNSSGFTALAGGARSENGNFLDISLQTAFWTCTETSSSSTWIRSLGYSNSEVYRAGNSLKDNGFSVRCLRDLFLDTLTVIPGDRQVTLKWPSTYWEYMDKVYIYRNLVLSDSVEITSVNDTVFADTNLFNYQDYNYFIQIKDIWGDISITTDSITIMPSVQVTDFDGNVYNTIKIGKQVWMKENMKTTKYTDGNDLVDGTGAGNISGNYSTKYWFVYGNNLANKSTYGLLYTWAAVMNGAASSNANPSGVQGICPNGWHLPSDLEWKELELFLGMSPEEIEQQTWRGSVDGKLKETGTLHWDSPNLGATNESGFTGLGGGYRYQNGYNDINVYNSFWSSTQSGSTRAFRRCLGCCSVQIGYEDLGKDESAYVRCLMDFDYLPYISLSADTIDFGIISENIPDTVQSVVIANSYNDTIFIDSIYCSDPSINLDVQGTTGLINITIAPGDTVELNVTLNTENLAGHVTDTIGISINSYDTLIMLTATIIFFPDTIKAISGNQQITLT